MERVGARAAGALPLPVWIARGLSNSKIWQEFKAKTQTRPSPGLRVVLSLGPETALPATPVSSHEIAAIESVANTGTGFLVEANVLAARVSFGAGGDEAPVVMAADGGVITVRGKRYTFRGLKQRAVIRHLFEAWNSGQPECLTAAVLEGAEYSDSVNRLEKAFSGRKDWREFIEEKTVPAGFTFKRIPNLLTHRNPPVVAGFFVSGPKNSIPTFTPTSLLPGSYLPQCHSHPQVFAQIPRR